MSAEIASRTREITPLFDSHEPATTGRGRAVYERQSTEKSAAPSSLAWTSTSTAVPGLSSRDGTTTRTDRAEKIAEARALIKDAIDTGKTEIDLRTQSAEVLREACEIRTLTKLTLRDLGPTIKTLPKEIAKLELLEGLYFDSNEISSLPPEIGALSKLQTFYGYHNKLTTLPEAFGNLKEIRKLVLWSNELVSLPKSFGNLKKMTECELKWNKIKMLPDEIAGLESVEDFDVCSNALKDLPSDLSGMKKLRRMQLKDNKLTSFPRGLLTLPALVELDLGENGLRELPDGIANIKTLREIDLDENALTSLPKKLFSLPLTKCFRFEDKEMSGLTFKGRAERRGWRRGSVVDSGGVSAYRKVFPHDRVEVFIGTDGLNVQSFDDSDVTLKDLFFVRSGAIVTGAYTYDEPRDEDDDRLIRLGEVPPI